MLRFAVAVLGNCTVHVLPYMYPEEFSVAIFMNCKESNTLCDTCPSCCVLIVRLGWRTHYLRNSPGSATGTISDEMASKRSEDEYGEKVNRAIVDTGVKMGKTVPKDRTDVYIAKVVVKQMQRKFELEFALKS